MTRKPPARGRYAAAAVVVVLIALPVLYVLSIGPAVWIHENGNLNSNTKEAIRAAYIPLEGLADRFEPLEDALDMYIDLWD